MSAVRNLGAGALALGLAAPFVGSPYSGSHMDLDGMAVAIAAGQDHVSALQLAKWIKERKPGLRVIDVRSQAEFASFSIPSAENIPVEQIPKASFGPQDIVVLYSEGGAHAAQAWVFLRARGFHEVYFIAGGLADWRDEVISPVLPADASPAQAIAFQPIADLSRYFGGAPVTGPAGSRATMMEDGDAAAQLARIRRRGCKAGLGRRSVRRAAGSGIQQAGCA